MSDSPFREAALGNPGRWTDERLAKIPEYKARIVELIASGLFLSEICDAIDVGPRTVRAWRRADQEFDEAYADAEAAHLDRIEKEATRRAVQGVLEPVVSAGRLVMDPSAPGSPLMVRRYSDSLMMFILKGRRRDVYGDRVQTENKHTIDVTGVRDELARRLSALTGPGQET